MLTLDALLALAAADKKRKQQQRKKEREAAARGEAVAGSNRAGAGAGDAGVRRAFIGRGVSVDNSRVNELTCHVVAGLGDRAPIRG